MQVTCSKRGKVRWIKMQFISFPMLWPNYGASFFRTIKSYRIGLDVKGCWFTASVSWLKLNPTCIKILSALSWTRTKISLFIDRTYCISKLLPLRDVVGVRLISSYILTAVTTAHEPDGQEIIPVRTKWASKKTRFTMVGCWSLRIFKIMFIRNFPAQQTFKLEGTSAKNRGGAWYNCRQYNKCIIKDFTVISFFTSCIGRRAKIRRSSSDILIFLNDAIWTQTGLFCFLVSLPLCFELVPPCPRYLALQTLLSLWGWGAERWQ